MSDMAKNIVAVDDDKTVRALLRTYVEAMGHNVSEAKNGLEYLEKFEGQEVDPLLLDILMPEMDGATLLHKLAEKKSKEPIILVSSKEPEFIGMTLPMVKKKGLNICGSIKKPIDQEELAAMINEAMAFG